MVETPTGKLLRVTDTYTEGVQVEAFLGTSIRQRLSVAAAPDSASIMCPFDTGPQPTPIIHSSRGGEEQRAAAPSQLKHLINQFYLKRLVLPRVAEGVQPLCFTFVQSCPVALTLSFHTANSCQEPNMEKKNASEWGNVNSGSQVVCFLDNRVTDVHQKHFSNLEFLSGKSNFELLTGRLCYFS